MRNFRAPRTRDLPVGAAKVHCRSNPMIMVRKEDSRLRGNGITQANLKDHLRTWMRGDPTVAKYLPARRGGDWKADARAAEDVQLRGEDSDLDR
jgi:hypothetical protein